MTVYNREKYLAEAIESVLDSDYTQFELIIVDDCSADRSVEIARRYQQYDSRIIIHVNEKNLGQFGNRNHALKFAKGVYVKYVDSDDKIFPDGLSRLVAAMEMYPEASFGMYYLTDKNIPPFVMDGKAAIRKHFFESSFLSVGPVGTILRTAYLKELGGYPCMYEAAGDMYFNLKACCYTSIVMLPFEFVFYRVHGEQELNNPLSYLYCGYNYYRDAMQYLPLGLTEQERLWFIKKNKRRFVVNALKYLIRTKNIKGLVYAVKAADFHFKDLLVAVFQR